MIESTYDEGIEKGEFEVAANMLRMGLLTADQIAQATGLSADEVGRLSPD